MIREGCRGVFYYLYYYSFPYLSMKKPIVFLRTVGRGAIANTKYTEEDIRNDFVYVETLGEINKSKASGKKVCVVEVDREKVHHLKKILENDGYSVEAQHFPVK